jgi:uncharacterized peroxidase-related enzyme
MSVSFTQLLPSLPEDRVPAESRPLLDKVKKGFGYVPNLFAAFANSPVLLEGYTTLDAVFQKGTLTPTERELVLLAASVANECEYCIAAHSTVAKRMLNVSPAIVSAIRLGAVVPEAKLSALVNLTKGLVAGGGHVGAATIRAFLVSGYRPDQIGEVLVGVALKTLSNYTHHLSPVEIDPAFAAEREVAPLEHGT